MPRASWRGAVAALVLGCGATGAVAQGPGMAPLPAMPAPPAMPAMPAGMAMPTGMTPPTTAAPGPAAPAGGLPGGTAVSAGAAMPAGMMPAVVPVSGSGGGIGMEAPAGVMKDLTPHGFAEACPPAHGGHAEEHGHNPMVSTEAGLYGSAEYLLFRPRRGAFDYAIRNTNQGLATAGRIESLNFELRSGVRTELGYRLEGGWELFAGYTYFRTNADGTLAAPAGQVLYPTLTRPGLTDNATQAVANANLQYNVYDILAGKRWAVDEHLALRVFGGVRFASVRQDFTARYDGLDARQAQASANHKFDGFGPLLGGEVTCGGWGGFHLYGRGSAGLLTGQNRSPAYDANNGNSTIYTDVVYDQRTVVPVMSLAVGAGWQYRTVWVRAGYEVTNYFDLIQTPRFVDDVSSGKFVNRSANLSLEGLVVQVGMTF